jgi:YD repeat-containing protein
MRLPWVYNAAGNMTEGPTPGNETTKHKYIYDAWNRLVKVTDNSDVGLEGSTVNKGS